MTTTGLKKYLKKIWKQENGTFALPKVAPLLVGAPGIGKTSIVTQVAEELGIQCFIELLSMSDPTDASGLPANVNGKATFLPFDTFQEILTTDKPTIVFFDDIGQAPTLVQGAFMNWMTGKVGNKIVPKNIRFIGATNAKAHKAGVQGMLEPFKSRFSVIITIEPCPVDLAEHFMKIGMPTTLIAFIRLNPAYLVQKEFTMDIKNSHNSRTIEALGWQEIIDIDPSLEAEIFKGCCGEAFASDYIQFKNLQTKIPDPLTVLMNPDTAPIPDNLGAQTLVLTTLARIAKPEQVGAVITYAKRFREGKYPAELETMCIKFLAQKKKNAETHAYADWLTENHKYQ